MFAAGSPATEHVWFESDPPPTPPLIGPCNRLLSEPDKCPYSSGSIGCSPAEAPTGIASAIKRANPPANKQRLGSIAAPSQALIVSPPQGRVKAQPPPSPFSKADSKQPTLRRSQRRRLLVDELPV